MRPKISQQQIQTALKGFAMGTADIIPGVSGGTIAFITGIYPKLIETIASFGVADILALFQVCSPNRETRQRGWTRIKAFNWGFVIPLGVGLAAAIATMARVMPYLLDTYPFFMFSLFFGLILFSVTVPFREMKKAPVEFAAIAVFTGVSLLAFGEPSGEPGSTHPAYLFLCGAIAICSMILPGISGSYILVLLGEYKIVLTAVKSHDMQIVLPFLMGIVVGITLFSRVLKYLLKHYHSLTMAALTGFLLGSLKVLWPGNHSEEFLNSPGVTATGVGAILAGAIALWALERVAAKLR